MPNQRPSERVVRAAQLEHRLRAHDEEIALKTSTLLAIVYEKYIAPIEEQVAFLELPFYHRWWIRLGKAWTRLLLRFRPVPEPEQEDIPVMTPEALAERARQAPSVEPPGPRRILRPDEA